MPWADALTNVRLPLDLKHMPRSEAEDRAGQVWRGSACRDFEHAYPRDPVRRHEDAGLAGAGSGGAAEAILAGRTLRARWMKSPGTALGRICCGCGAKTD